MTTVVVLGAKAALAVMLLVAGGAKLADLDGFAAAVALFVPRRLAGSPRGGSLLRRAALALTACELALGGASLAAPELSWLNLAVLAAGGTFLAVSGAGFAFHRGRSCRCFGALSQRRFDLAGTGRAAVIAAGASVAAIRAPASAVRLGPAGHGLLLAAALLLPIVAFTAARSLAVSRDALAGMVS